MRSIAALLFAVFALCVSPQAGLAQATSEADAAAIRSVIRSQLEAFKQDDGDTAYSFAAPNIKQIFPTADAFMAMVRHAYQPVYRPRTYTFGALELKDGIFTQSVDILGPDGDYWTAVYTLAQQPDGTWKITSCHLAKSGGAA